MMDRRIDEQKRLLDERIEKVTHKMNKYKTSPDAEMKLLDSFLRYPGYSIRNIILAESQNEESFGLASSNEFQAMGYSVEESQRAIVITLSNWEKIFKDKAGRYKLVQHANQQEKQAITEESIRSQLVITHYKSVPVYDISQTDCPPELFCTLYPEIPVNYAFNRSSEDYECLEKTLHEYANEKGLANHLMIILNAKKENFFVGEKEDTLNKQFPLTERTELFIRGLVHAEIDNYQQVAFERDSTKRRKLKKDQKEMVVYVVSRALGIDSENYTQRYLMVWRSKVITDDMYIQMLAEVKEISLSLIDILVQKFNKLKKEETSR